MSAEASKPKLTQSEALDLVRRLFETSTSSIRSLPSFSDQNFCVTSDGGEKFVLKITNTEDSGNPELIELHMDVMLFLRRRGLPAQTPLQNIHGKLWSLEELDCGYGPQKYLVRLLTYLPGTPLSQAARSPQLLYQVGRSAAKMDRILQELQHPNLSLLEEKTIWNLCSVGLVRSSLHVLHDDSLQEMVKDVLHQYETCVTPKYSEFHRSIIHGDFNDFNILVQPDDSNELQICGILDFADVQDGYSIHELAISIMHMSVEHQNPIEAGGPVLAGFESVLPLTQTERDCLYVLVLCRLCQALVYVRQVLAMHPENEDYLASVSNKSAQILQELWRLGKRHVEGVWFDCADQLAEKYGSD